VGTLAVSPTSFKPAPLGPATSLLRMPHASETEELQLEVSMLLLEDIEAGRLEIPPLPRTAVELSRLVVSQKARLEDIVKLVERDVQLAGRVLKLASSVAYGREKIVDLRRAIVRVGMSGVRNIALSVAVAKAFRAGPLEPYLKLETRHAYVTAVGAAWLAPKLHTDPQHAFLSGLMHDVGCSALLALVARRSVRDPSLLKLETVLPLLHQMHTDVGAAVLGHWGLTDSVREVAQMHHLAHRQTPSNPTNQAVALADAIDELPVPDSNERVLMLLDHPVRHQVKLPESDVKKLIEIMEEAGRDESLHALTG
jgi:HD-like signal output (HDOD) protein